MNCVKMVKGRRVLVCRGFMCHLQLHIYFLILLLYHLQLFILSYERFLDPPGKPGVPECTGTTEDSIALSWDPPTKDGGKPIKGYILEKRDKGGKKWIK